MFPFWRNIKIIIKNAKDSKLKIENQVEKL